MEIKEGNKLIAGFMGGKYRKANKQRFIGERFFDLQDKGYYYLVSDLKYHSSWDWLMPVVEKIFKMSEPETNHEVSEYVTEYFFRTFGMQDDKHQFLVRINGFSLHESKSLIEATWQAVIEFINWYNKQSLTLKEIWKEK